MPQVTLADHIRAIAVTADREAVETKETGSGIPTGVREPQVENVEIVKCLEVNPPEGEPETLSTPEGDLHTPVFPEMMGLNMLQAFQKELQAMMNQKQLCCIVWTTHWLSHQPIFHHIFSLWLTL